MLLIYYEKDAFRSIAGTDIYIDCLSRHLIFPLDYIDYSLTNIAI